MNKPLYIDANVIIARYKPVHHIKFLNPPYKVSNELFNRRFDFLISPVTLFELYSVISRLRSSLVLPKEAMHVSVDTVAHFIVEDSNLKLISRTYLKTIYFKDQRIRIPLEYQLSTILVGKLKLRALDLLIAYASILENKVQIFVTGDLEIIERKNIIRNLVGLKVKYP